MSTSSDNAPDPACDPNAAPRPYAGRLTDAECEALQARRARNGTATADDGSTPIIGLALSGGGIRSATFCLGLLRGLAQRGVLKRFDYLSTVSGGGYIGAMFARLVCALDIDRAQSVLARSDSIPLSWLRRYGRYLAPMGARDFGIGIATYLRAIIAVHMEFAMMALLVGLLATLAYTADAQAGALDARAWSAWGSAWWPLAAACWLAVAPGLLVLYWMVRAGPMRTPDADTGAGMAQPATIGLIDGLLIVGSGIFGLALVAGWAEPWWTAIVALWSGPPGGAWPALPGPTWSLAAGMGLASIGVVGAIAVLRLSVALRTTRPVSLPAARKSLTAWLRAINLLTVSLAALGLLDWLSWELHKVLSASFAGLFGGLGLGGAFLLAIRALSEPLQRTIQSSEGARGDLLPKLVNAAGYALAFGLVLLWTTLVQHLVYGGFSLGTCLPSLPAQTCDALVSSAGWRWAFVALLPLAWFFATGWNADNANASSLHNMYSARLARAYLGAANPARFGGEDALQASATDTSPEALSDVTEVDESDDVPLRAHRPPDKGGPIHLVNVCLNQTRGHQTRLYNADRKGVPMVLSGYGIDVGHKPLREGVLDHIGGLARWVGISGAAASPGAGVNTTPGWAALLFLAGARLGYWLNLGDAWTALERGVAARAPRWWELRFAKMLRLYAEFRAAYVGPLAPDWYLSDGGHFDNTGVHPLLQRQLDLIVLADCGADPKFEYADLENLVRKARIDYGAEIEFYRADDANRRFGPPDGTGPARLSYLSPQELINNHTARGVLLARILYRADAQGRRREGTLLVFKPNLHALLDVDILAYAKRRRDFPQQGTGDQFFDEAQWESYHRLGEDVGTELGPDMLARLPGWSQAVLLAPDRQSRIATSSLSKPDDEQRPFWKIETRQAAVGALSLGALVAVLMPVWQAFDNWRQEQTRNRETLGRMLEQAETIFQRASRRAAQHRAYQEMLERLQPAASGVAGAAPAADAVVARFRAFDAHVGEDLLAGQLVKDLDARLGALRTAAAAPAVDARALDAQIAVLARLLRQRQQEYADPASYSDQMAIARFRQLGAVVRGDTPDVQVASDFMAMAESACRHDSAASRPDVLCRQFVRGDVVDIDESSYWARLRLRQDQETGEVHKAPNRPRAMLASVQTSAAGVGNAAVYTEQQMPKAVALPGASSIEPKPVAATGADGDAAPEDARVLPVEAAVVALPSVADACRSRPTRLYVQIYEEASRDQVEGLAWGHLGDAMKMQGVENVSITAAAQGRRRPTPYAVPTLVVHDLGRDRACAAALADWIALQLPSTSSTQAADAPAVEFRIRTLPRGYSGRSGVIELWWPPQDVQAGSGVMAGR
jgi:hypothetical protein